MARVTIEEVRAGLRSAGAPMKHEFPIMGPDRSRVGVLVVEFDKLTQVGYEALVSMGWVGGDGERPSLVRKPGAFKA